MDFKVWLLSEFYDQIYKILYKIAFLASLFLDCSKFKLVLKTSFRPRD